MTGGRGAGGRNTVDKIRSREPEEGEEGSSRGGLWGMVDQTKGSVHPFDKWWVVVAAGAAGTVGQEGGGGPEVD